MAKEFMPLSKPKTVADMRNTSKNLKAEAANKKTPISMPSKVGPTEKIRPGFRPEGEVKPMPKGGREPGPTSITKPQTSYKPISNKKTPMPVTNERPPTSIPKPPTSPKPMPKGGRAPMATKTEKPLTNTSGTADKKKGSAWFDKMKKSIEFGAKYAGNAGVMAAALGVPVRKGSSVINPSEQSIMPAGTILPAKVREMGKPTKTEKPPTDTGSGGIDAPAPDTGWRPSGTNTASGLQQKTMGVALQEQIGVTKRRR